MTTHQRSTLPSTKTPAKNDADSDSITLFYEKIEQLKHMYYEDLQTKIQHITKDWHELESQWNDQLFENMYRSLHNLAGSGATFGFVALGQIAREMTDILKPVFKKDVPLSEEAYNHIMDLLVQLRSAAGLSKETSQEHTLFIRT